MILIWLKWNLFQKSSRSIYHHIILSWNKSHRNSVTVSDIDWYEIYGTVIIWFFNLTNTSFHSLSPSLSIFVLLKKKVAQLSVQIHKIFHIVTFQVLFAKVLSVAQIKNKFSSFLFQFSGFKGEKWFKVQNEKINFMVNKRNEILMNLSSNTNICNNLTPKNLWKVNSFNNLNFRLNSFVISHKINDW